VTSPLRHLDLDEDPPGPVPAVLALGSNLGDREAALAGAVTELAGYEGVRVRAVSPVVETAPVGGPEQPDYLNAVVLVTTALSPLALLAVCQQVETEYGRRRGVRWGPRTLDVDLITYADLVARCADLEIPHPRAASRAFVLVPWARTDPEAVLPDAAGPGRPARVTDLLTGLDTAGVRWREDVELRVPS